MAFDNAPVVQQQEGEHHDVAICSRNKGSCSSCHEFSARSSALLAAGGIVFLCVLVVVTIVTTTVTAQNEETTLKPAMTTPQPAGVYQGNCILVDRETRIVDSYKEEAASVNQFESDSGCIVSVDGQEVLYLVGKDCDTAAAAKCVAYPYADWCAHAEYKPFCLPQNECTNPFEFDSSLLSEKVSFEKCENGVLTFIFNGTYSDDAPLVKYVDDGKIVIDASGTVKVINSAHFKPDRDFSDGDPSIAIGKDVTLVILGNVFCDDTKTTKYVCENLTEWQDELATWRPWEYPCWIYPEIGEGKIATPVQLKELCG